MHYSGENNIVSTKLWWTQWLDWSTYHFLHCRFGAQQQAAKLSSATKLGLANCRGTHRKRYTTEFLKGAFSKRCRNMKRKVRSMQAQSGGWRRSCSRFCCPPRPPWSSSSPWRWPPGRGRGRPSPRGQTSSRSWATWCCSPEDTSSRPARSPGSLAVQSRYQGTEDR